MSEEKKTVEQIAEGINKSIEELKSSIGKKADLTALEEKHGEISEKLNALDPEKMVSKEDFTTQQEQLDEISTQLKQLGELQGGQEKSVYKQLSENFQSDDFKEKVKSYSGKGEIAGFEIKAADIDTDDINSGTIVDLPIDRGVASAPWRGTPIWDNINKGTIGQGRDQISWWEETTRTDSAEMVSEQAAPVAGSAKTWTKQSMDIKMIKDYTKISKSALEDFEYITSEVNDLMQNGIPRKRESELLSGAGTTVYLKGITQYAKAFAKPANFNAVSAPNEGDVLAAALLQCMNGNTTDTQKKGFIPNVILVNPGDKINMRLLKASIESYIQHPMLSLDGSKFEGATLVPSLDLTAGQFVLGDFSRAKVYIKRQMRISFHYENEDDVLNDLILVLASMRIAGIKVAASDEYAFVTGTFSASKELIIAT